MFLGVGSVGSVLSDAGVLIHHLVGTAVTVDRYELVDEAPALSLRREAPQSRHAIEKKRVRTTKMRIRFP
jgi:hypothetical protein